MAPRSETSKGIWATAAAFGLWGLVPIYWKAVEAVPARELIAYRVLWALPFLALLLTLGRGWPRVRAVLRNRRVLGMLVLSAALIAVNWFVFIEAVAGGRVMQASLGYYINPLVNVVLGYVVLGERLSRPQGLAVALATVGVGVLIAATGELPVTALVLATTFALYGLVRKVVAVDAMPGLFFEVLLIVPLALAYLAALHVRGEAVAGVPDGVWALVPLSGLITALPLAWFAYGARRLRLATVGLLQFLAPTGQFLLSLTLFGERFTAAHAVTFVLIWAGLALYLFDLQQRQRRRRRLAAAAAEPAAGA